MLEIGTKAPDFALLDKNGEMVRLSDYIGKKIVLYFYKKKRHAMKKAKAECLCKK